MYMHIDTQMNLFSDSQIREEMWHNEIHEEFNKLRNQLDDVMSEIDSMDWGRICDHQ